MRFWILGLCLLWTVFAHADHHNIIKAPHGLGQFHEEPTGYRYSLKGADKFIASFEGVNHLNACVPSQDDLVRRITGSMTRWPRRPMLGGTGPSDYPQIVFSVSKIGHKEIKLSAQVYLFFPAHELKKTQSQKVLAFQYTSQHSLTEVDCLQNITQLIDALVDQWMQDHASYNNVLAAGLL